VVPWYGGRLRSASSADLTVPATRRSTLADRVFAVAGPREFSVATSLIRSSFLTDGQTSRVRFVVDLLYNKLYKPRANQQQLERRLANTRQRSNILATCRQDCGQDSLTERLHRCRAYTVQSYSPGCASVHPYLIPGSLGPPESTTQTASRSVQPFLQGSRW